MSLLATRKKIYDARWRATHANPNWRADAAELRAIMHARGWKWSRYIGAWVPAK